MPETQIIEGGKPVGQGNSGWLTDATHGKGPAFPRKSPSKSVATPAVQPASTQAPPGEPGTTVQPASAQPSEVQASQTPAVQPPPEVIPAAAVPPAAGQPESPATPVASAAEPRVQPQKVVVIDDPNTVLQVKNPDGTITEKTAATIEWEKGLRANLNRKDSELELKKQELDLRERELALRERAAAAPAQPQQTVTQPVTDPMPVPPVGKIDGVDPEWDNYRAELTGWHVRQGVKPLTDAFTQAQATAQQSQQQRQVAQENYEHNKHLINSVLPSMLPFDLDALEASDPAACEEALGRIRMAGRSKGIDLSPEGLKNNSGKIDESTLEVIALRAFSDGWNPTLRKAAPAAQVSAPPPAATIDPVAAELSRKLANGEPLVPPGDPTQPLIPVAPSGSPAGNSPNRPSQGNSSSTVPSWRERLGQAKG